MKLIYVRADWCGVCHAKSPVVDEVARTAGLPLDRVDWETEEGQTRALGLRVNTVPTLALVDGERVRFRLVGSAITPETAAHLIGMYLPAKEIQAEEVQAKEIQEKGDGGDG